MALGDVFILDDAFVEIGGTDLSDAVKQCKLTVSHTEVSTPHTFGKSGAVTAVSEKYTWSLDVDFVTDEFGAGGVDAIMTALMPAPLGASTTQGKAAIEIRPDSAVVSASNPKYTGNVIIGMWEPLGGGAVGEIVTQTRTFQGSGDLTRATA